MNSAGLTGAISARNDVERVAMDTREKRPIAPFELGRAGSERAAQDRAVRFQGQQRRVRICFINRARTRKRRGRRRPGDRQSIAKQLEERRLARPRA